MRAPVMFGVLALLAAAAACVSSPGLLDPYAGAPVLTPAAASAPPRGAIPFSASGGSGPAYRFTFAANRSGGSVDAVTGGYVAGAKGSVDDIVQVEDSAGRTMTATVTVGAGVSISPARLGVAPGRGPVQFVASGGSGTGWSWSLATNLSGGWVYGSGYYNAGMTQGVSDYLQAVDSLGNVGTARIDVADIFVFPDTITMVAGARYTFTACVTSEPSFDVTWQVVEGGAGGTIAATTPATSTTYSTCDYVAPATAGTFHVQATSVMNPSKSGRAVVVVVP